MRLTTTCRHAYRSAALALFVLLLIFTAEARGVTINWTPVGNPGNPADTTVMTLDGTTGYGSVAYNYLIGTYDVTNSQYVEFLNIKDPTGANPLGLYNTGMSNGDGGINYSAGNAIGGKYGVISGRGNHPATYTTWYDATRFANWLNNGQGNGDTETGAYTLLGGTPIPSNALTITRNAGATVFLPSENEWYKAAYYNPATSSYFQSGTSSNLAPTASLPTATPNSANYNMVVGNPTDVGAYTGTTSPYGAFDMAGNVWQWNEALILIYGSYRGMRGGSYHSVSSVDLLSSLRNDVYPPSEDGTFGFRLASLSVPEPSSGVLATMASGGIAVWTWRRRKRLGR